MKTQRLHPTLWRTCRILSGNTRLQLLRRVIDLPEQTVSSLANQLGLSLPRTSQELRRLQSRGLIQADRKGMNVLYRPVPDPLVSTAAPLLRAMQATFHQFPDTNDEQALRIAVGLSHERRLRIVRLLLIGPMTTRNLEDMTGISRDALNRHLLKLQEAGLVERSGRRIQVTNNPHPLAQGLLDILRNSPVPRG